jgi:hypothetical protein
MPPSVYGQSPWNTYVLRRVLTSPRLIGLRSHKGEVVAVRTGSRSSTGRRGKHCVLFITESPPRPLREAIEPHLGPQQTIILDLSGVEFQRTPPASRCSRRHAAR